MGGPTPVQRRQLVEQARQVEQIDGSDPLDLPADQVELTVALLVSSGTDEMKMRRVRVDLHRPSNRSHRHVDPDSTATGQHQVIDLGLDRNTTIEQTSQYHQLRVRLGRSPPVPPQQHPGELG